MIQCALTGGIGTGKSLVCKIFSILGAVVFNADEAAKSLYAQPGLISRISATFGSACVKEGKVDLKTLADKVFNDHAALEKLNQMIHPLVMEEYQQWLAQQAPDAVCIMESAIIFEAGLHDRFDRIICVYAPEQVCIDRIVQRDGVSKEKARLRLNAQMNPDIKVKKSHHVIINDDQQLVIPQVIDVYSQLITTR